MIISSNDDFKKFTPKTLEPNDPMPFGKYAGEEMGNVPDSYFEWLYYEEDIAAGPVRDYIEEFIV